MKNRDTQYRKILLLILFFPMAMHAAIYQKTEAGGLFFSDMASPGATVVTLKTANTYAASPISNNPSVTKTAINKDLYQTFLLIEPRDQQNFQNQTEVSGNIQIAPLLKAGDAIQWWLDNALYQQGMSTEIRMKALDRGEHTLQAKLLGAKNNLLSQTQKVTFYLHAARVDQ
jgi:hypothetical protein